MAGVEAMLDEARKSLGLGEPNHIQRWYANRNGSAFNYNFAWCNAAVTYWAAKSGNHKAVCFGKDYAYTVWHAQRFQKAGQWFPGTSANVRNARPGDIVFFDWGNTDSISRIDHVGIVEKNLGGGVLQTIEGNTSNQCLRRRRNASTIAGYGRPNYVGGSAPSEPEPDEFEALRWDGEAVHVPTGDVWLTSGSRGMDVKRVQNACNVVFGESLDVDGIYGPLTEEAVARMQIAMGSPAGGDFGPITSAALIEYIRANDPAKKPKPEPPKPEPEPAPPKEWPVWHYPEATITRPLTVPHGEIRKGDSGEHVRYLQMALNFVGAGWQVHASGEFGKCTEDSVKSFQKTVGLEETGVYTVSTAEALNSRVAEGQLFDLAPPPVDADKLRDLADYIGSLS